MKVCELDKLWGINVEQYKLEHKNQSTLVSVLSVLDIIGMILATYLMFEFRLNIYYYLVALIIITVLVCVIYNCFQKESLNNGYKLLRRYKNHDVVEFLVQVDYLEVYKELSKSSKKLLNSASDLVSGINKICLNGKSREMGYLMWKYGSDEEGIKCRFLVSGSSIYFLGIEEEIKNE